MRKPSDWDTTRAAQSGEYERLSLGGHVCKIIKAQMTSDRNGHEQMELYLDIAEGTEYDGIFRRQYDQFSGSNGKWPNGGTFRQFTRDYSDQSKTNPYFKGLIQAVIDSNPNYVWDWNERSLTGKYIGFVFGEEEYLNNNNEKRTAVKARFCCAAADAPEKEAPKLKELRQSGGTATTATQSNGFTQVDDDELPF